MVSKVERLSITIPIECAQALNERAASDKANKSAVITAALRAYLSGAYIVENVSDTTKSYSNNDIKITSLEYEITSLNTRLEDKDEIIRGKNEQIEMYRGILSGQIVQALPPGPAEGDTQDTEDRQDKQDKKQGPLTRVKAWLSGK